jgi:hypothetical protein
MIPEPPNSPRSGVTLHGRHNDLALVGGAVVAAVVAAACSRPVSGSSIRKIIYQEIVAMGELVIRHAQANDAEAIVGVHHAAVQGRPPPPATLETCSMAGPDR